MNKNETPRFVQSLVGAVRRHFPEAKIDNKTRPSAVDVTLGAPYTRQHTFYENNHWFRPVVRLVKIALEVQAEVIAAQAAELSLLYRQIERAEQRSTQTLGENWGVEDPQ